MSEKVNIFSVVQEWLPTQLLEVGGSPPSNSTTAVGFI